MLLFASALKHYVLAAELNNVSHTFLARPWSRLRSLGRTYASVREAGRVSLGCHGTRLSLLPAPLSKESRVFPTKHCLRTLHTSQEATKVLPEAPIDKYRLPRDVKPVHYDLCIRTDLEALTFDGNVLIDLEILKQTSTIVFHASDLNIERVGLISDSSTEEQTPVSQILDKDFERVTLQFSAEFPANSKAKLNVRFGGKLTGSLMGYYYSSWEKDGGKKYYTLTQFEPTAARRTFPCWDEPLLKATYNMAMVSRQDTVNLSNMPVVSETPYGNSAEWKITKFERSPPMSTYLVAFANGHFDYLESAYVSPLSGKTRPLRIYATENYISQARFALDIKKKVLPLYEKMFDIEFPLPKLDTLIVSDFDAGAMENWGLITGRASDFCLDPKKVGIAAQKRIATVQSHEVAHMWFGDITTMAWWDNLYLNEGFATLMGEVIIMDKIFPEWKVYTEFLIDHLNRCLLLDSKLSSHPIEMPCPDPNKLYQIFDTLSYSKAASVLRMLSNFVGEETFLRGVSIYLRKHLYANSVSKDLWNGIGKAAQFDVAEMMDNWVSKTGFPLITVTEDDKGIHVRQDRYLETGHAPDEHNQTIWQIPLSIVTVGANGKKTISSSLLKGREMTIPLDVSKPFKLNYDTSGVYRVLYTPERLVKIGIEAARQHSLFNLNDRIGLVSDVFALGNAGYGNSVSALELVNNLRHEREHLLWQGISNSLDSFSDNFWEAERPYELLKTFRASLYRPIIDELGYDFAESDSAEIKQLRSLAISGGASTDVPLVIEELKRRFNDYVQTGDDSGIALDIEKSTYMTVVKHGGRAEYDAVMTIYEKPKTPTTQTAAIYGLCSATEQSLIDRTFGLLLTKVKDQDFYKFVFGLSGNRKTRRRFVAWFKENYDEIYRRFSSNTQLTYIISSTFKLLSKESDARDVEEFFKDKDVSKFDLSLHQALDEIRARAAVVERCSGDIIQWLEKWERQNTKL